MTIIPFPEKRPWGLVLTALLMLKSLGSLAQYQEFSGRVLADYRYFPKPELVEGQGQHFPSMAIEPKYFHESEKGNHHFTAIAFFRLDRDSKRTHFDIRELYWQTIQPKWELNVGLKKIFWGVTESIHLVDIINQTDVVESFDGEEKLGQPMVQFTYPSPYGTLDLFLMTYHRKRIYPGEVGRLRPPFEVLDLEPIYQSQAEQFHTDLAIRWSHTFNVFDIGLSHFYGNSREPLFQISDDLSIWVPFYALIHQTGFDLQATTGSFLWKVEVMRRQSDFQTMTAVAGGFEYTLYNLFQTGLDLGLLTEYLYDDRGSFALSGMDNDVFLGARLGFNDKQSTEVLMGTILDINKATRLYSIEGNRRIGNSWKAEVEVRLFDQLSNDEFLYLFRQDNFVEFSLAKYF